MYLVMRYTRKRTSKVSKKGIQMKVIIAGIVVLALLTAEPTSAKCKPDEVEFCSSTQYISCFCRKCISCPAGYGPSLHCTEQYTDDKIMTCKPCKKDETFSDKYSIASCEPCAQCGHKKTLYRCTIKSDSICSDECKYGYKMDPIIDDCVRDYSVAMTTKLLNPLASSTAKPKTETFHTSTTTQTIFTQSKLETTKSLFNMRSSEEDLGHSRENKIILITVLVIIVFMIIFHVTYILYKKIIIIYNARQQENASNWQEKLALTSKESAKMSKNQEEHIPWPADLKLIHISHDLKINIGLIISEQSSVVKTWRNIADKMKFSDNDIRAITVHGRKEGTNAGEQLLIKLSSTEPSMTLSEFVSILEELEIRNVVEIIKNHYQHQVSINVMAQSD